MSDYSPRHLVSGESRSRFRGVSAIVLQAGVVTIGQSQPTTHCFLRPTRFMLAKYNAPCPQWKRKIIIYILYIVDVVYFLNILLVHYFTVFVSDLLLIFK